jgi:Na+-driven multidrug efflux pump
MHSEADRARRLRFLLLTLSYVIVLITGLYIGAWYFGSDVLRLWVGPKLTIDQLQLSHRILLILLGAYLVALPCSIFRAFLFAMGIVKVPALIYIVEATLNLAASLWLCHGYGIEGVAWGTTVPVMIIELGILLPYAIHQLGVSRSRFIREALWPPIIPLVCLWGCAALVSSQSWSHDSILGLFIAAISGGAVLGGTWWLTRVQWPRMVLAASSTRSA